MLRKILAISFIIFFFSSLLAIATSDEKKVEFLNKTQSLALGVNYHSKNIEGYEVKYLEAGIGNSDLAILIHGFGGSKENWFLTASKLSEVYHVVAVDLPGFGKTKAIEETYSIEDYSRFVMNFIKTFNGKNIHLIGHSTGGLISANLASRNPGLVKKLTLVSPLGARESRLSRFKENLQKGQNQLLPQTYDEFLILLSLVFEKQPPLPPWFKRVSYKFYENNMSFLEKTFVSTHGYKDGAITIKPSLEDLLSLYNGPVHIIWGDKDKVLDFSALDSLKKVDSKIEFTILSNIGHMPMLEDFSFGEKLH